MHMGQSFYALYSRLNTNHGKSALFVFTVCLFILLLYMPLGNLIVLRVRCNNQLQTTALLTKEHHNDHVCQQRNILTNTDADGINSLLTHTSVGRNQSSLISSPKFLSDGSLQQIFSKNKSEAISHQTYINANPDSNTNYTLNANPNVDSDANLIAEYSFRLFRFDANRCCTQCPSADVLSFCRESATYDECKGETCTVTQSASYAAAVFWVLCLTCVSLIAIAICIMPVYIRSLKLIRRVLATLWALVNVFATLCYSAWIYSAEQEIHDQFLVCGDTRHVQSEQTALIVLTIVMFSSVFPVVLSLYCYHDVIPRHNPSKKSTPAWI